MREKTTIDIYDEKAAEYGEMTKTLGELRELEAFAQALPAGARVLDLGCGPGFYAAWLAEKGFLVDATDASEKMVEMAVDLPGVTAWQATFDGLEAEGIYDGVWANFSLLHAPRAELAGHLDRVHRALTTGGLFHIGMKLGSGEGPDKIGRHYSYYSETELERLLHAAGFTISTRHKGRGRGLSGEMDDFITILAHG